MDAFDCHPLGVFEQDTPGNPCGNPIDCTRDYVSYVTRNLWRRVIG